MNERNVARVDRLALELDEDIRRLHPLAPKPRSGPNLPAYVAHHPEVDDIGRLSSEALAMAYESAAKEIEAMGQNLIEEVKSCEKYVLDAVRELEAHKAKTEAAVKECQATAEAYRDEAKKLFEYIQTKSMTADNVKQLCSEMIAKIKIE